jgi:hypothetical protein
VLQTDIALLGSKLLCDKEMDNVTAEQPVDENLH